MYTSKKETRHTAYAVKITEQNNKNLLIGFAFMGVTTTRIAHELQGNWTSCLLIAITIITTTATAVMIIIVIIIIIFVASEFYFSSLSISAVG